MVFEFGMMSILSIVGMILGFGLLTVLGATASLISRIGAIILFAGISLGAIFTNLGLFQTIVDNMITQGVIVFSAGFLTAQTIGSFFTG